nr:methyl-accepting chemotaxis protein [Sporolactobacillus mangiferae]
MNSILRGHQQLIQQMNDLVAQSQKIDQVFQLIGSIAEETNILSLNAAIEASRAGEAGKGFSVVADEIRKLSGETQQAVLETKESIQSIQNEIRQSTERVNQETTDINQGAEKLKKVITQLGGFRQKVETIKQSSKKSAESVNQQTASISAISELMNQISAMTQTNQALAETVEKDISTQFKSIAQMLDLNKQLIRTSDELQNSIQTDKGMVMTTDPELISQMKQTILHFINDHPLSPIETNRHRGILNTLKNNNPELEAVWSNLPDGSFIYSEPEAALANAGARQWFLEAMKGNIFVSEPYFSAITKQPCVTLSFPIQQSGQINGVFGADLTVHSD